MNNSRILPVFAVNLKSRTDRHQHIRQVFSGRPEFELTIVQAEEHTTGAIGLWNTIVKLISKVEQAGYEYIILCEDDHQFTEDYSPAALFDRIDEAIAHDADVLLGGPSWFSGALQVSPDLFWVDRFAGLQFTVLFRKFFPRILRADFRRGDAADYKIADLSENKYFIYPSISTQIEFGYSDATPTNNDPGRVDKLFDVSRKCAKTLVNVRDYYSKMGRPATGDEEETFENISIPAYIIHQPGRADRLGHITGEFSGKKEFDTRIIEASPHPNLAVSLFSSIKRIAGLAIANDDDVIAICEDDHQFTAEYSRHSFFQSIIEASNAGAEMISGGVGRIDQLFPVSQRFFWTSAVWHLQFVVLFKNVFQKILDEPIEGIAEGKDIFMQLTSHKMLLDPFISTKKDFGDPLYNVQTDQRSITEQFSRSIVRLDTIRKKADHLQMVG
ncbi:MAG: hypothetical protein JST68_18710 [Bacteroidetes bacterium]|nr:hypothetical protein [Bacteroidota bacterium]